MSSYHGVPPALIFAVRDVRYNGVAALTFLVWNAVLTFDEEVQCVWPMRNKNLFKWAYFYLRYGGIAAHVMHNWLIQYLGDGSNPPFLCDMWAAYIIVFTQSLATSLELILAFRVFALYNRSKKIAFLLLILIFMEVGTGARMLWVRHVAVTSYGPCLLIGNSAAKDQTIIAFIIHCILIGLTMFKYILGLRAGWGRSPLVSLVVRDGSTVYATMSFVLMTILLILGLEKERGIALFFWLTALMSISGCYLIVSMERLARKEIPIASNSREPIITSEFSIGVYGPSYILR